MRLSIIVFFGAGACGALFGDVCNPCKNATYSETYACIYGCVGFLIGVYIFIIYLIVHNYILVEVKCFGRNEICSYMFFCHSYHIYNGFHFWIWIEQFL